MAPAYARQALIFVPKVLAPMALVVWLGLMYLTLQYDATRPTVRQSEQGRVYGLDNHGHIVYLTAHEQENLHNLELLAIGLFLTAFLIDFSQRQRAYIGEIRGQIRENAYGLSTGAGWYALGRALQRRLASVGPGMAHALAQRTITIDIRSEDPISDCRDRLARDAYLNAMHISGSFTGKKLHLYVVRENFRNSFAPHFYGVLESRSGQTRLTGRFGMHFFVRIFLGMWFGFFTIIEVWLLAGYINSFGTGPYLGQNPHLSIFLPLAFIFSGLVVVHWCKELAKDDKTRITQFWKAPSEAAQSNIFEEHIL